MLVVSLVVISPRVFVHTPNRAEGAFSLARASIAVITMPLLIRRESSVAARRAQVAVVRLSSGRWCNRRGNASDARLALAAILGRIVSRS